MVLYLLLHISCSLLFILFSAPGIWPVWTASRAPLPSRSWLGLASGSISRRSEGIEGQAGIYSPASHPADWSGWIKVIAPVRWYTPHTLLPGVSGNSCLFVSSGLSSVSVLWFPCTFPLFSTVPEPCLGYSVWFCFLLVSWLMHGPILKFVLAFVECSGHL